MISKNDQSKSDAGHDDVPPTDAAINEPEQVATDTDTQPNSTNSADKTDTANDAMNKADEANELELKSATDTNGEAEEEKTPDLQQLQDRVAGLEDELLRNQAEMDNIRKRTRREVDKARKFALEPFVTALLPTIESLTKAQGSLSEGQQQGVESSPQTDGVALCLKLFLDTLEKFGVEEINPLGEPFNPDQQEAMTMVAQPEAEPNTVVKVLEVGYTLNKRLIRAAKVIISSSA